jgi:thiol-disulfide isomerase/thioredoxin
MRTGVLGAEHGMTSGLIALAAALAVAVAVGLAWQRAGGRIRGVSGAVGRAAPVMQDTAPDGTAPPGTGAAATALTAAQLGRQLGERATLVQFSSAFCAPCRATRRILAEVAGMTDGVTHVEIDAAARLDLVRSLSIYRTPTVLVLSPDGTVARRASGQPRRADVIAALADVV